MAKGLGKGFDSLLPADFDTTLLKDERDRIERVKIGKIHPNASQPRTSFDAEALEEMANSIRQHGILQPLIVRPLSKDIYQIVSGERRWRAAQIAGLTEVPVISRSLEELAELEISIIDNIQRVDLSPLEQAVSVERLHHQFNIPYEQIAKRLGKANSTLTNIVRLLQLPDFAKEALIEGSISEGHARSILALKGYPETQAELLELIINKHWSVRQAEQFVTAHKTGHRTTKALQKRVSFETPETKRLAEQLRTKVNLKRMAKGGRLEIHFQDDKDLQRLLKIFKTPS